MTKTEVARRLIEKGYDAGVAEGAVIIRVRKPPAQAEKNRMRECLRNMGYSGSWGWRAKKEDTE